MGVIKSWTLDIINRPDGTRSARGTVGEEYTGHRTGVCTMMVAEGKIWSGERHLASNFALSQCVLR